MTKYEWKIEFESKLKKLSKSEKQRALSYYDELFADMLENGKDESDIIETIGSPTDAAKRILYEINFEKEQSESKKRKVALQDIAACEKKNRFIQNGIVLIASIIVFICSFFTGAKIRLGIGDTVNVVVKQDMTDILKGTKSLFETDEETMQSYVDYVNSELNKIRVSVGETLTTPDLAAPNKTEKFLEKHIGNTIYKSTDINVVKYTIYLAKINCLNQDHPYSTSTQEDKREEAICYMYTVTTSLVLWGITVVLSVCMAVFSLLHIVLAIIALVRRKPMKHVFRSIMLPLIIAMFQWLILSINPLMYTGNVSIVVLTFLFVLLSALCAYQYIFERVAKEIAVKGFVKNMLLLVLSIASVFVLCGKTIGVRVSDVRGAHIWSLPVGFLFHFQKLMTIVGLDGIFTALILYAPFVVFYMVAGSLTIIIMENMWRQVYENNSQPIKIGKIVTALIFVSLALILLVFLEATNAIWEQITVIYPMIGLFAMPILLVGMLLANGLISSNDKKQKIGSEEKRQ